MKRCSIGLLAHVDAGKTTLSEALLYLGGQLRRPGRVDHGDAFLDTDALERQRGITIFSKQAMLPTATALFTLLDTPGHVDFSAEAERTLQVLDYAVLVISGADGVQSHTHTLWQLLRRYRIPTFLFINKNDLPGVDRASLMAALQKELDPACVDFSLSAEQRDDALSMTDETLLDAYLETGACPVEQTAELIRRRKVFPCYFGSALRMEGVELLLRDLEAYTVMPEYGEEFSARVFKIARDGKGTRLTFLKVTGGCLAVKAPLRGEGWEEKADQLRQYSGEKYTLLNVAPAGTICAVTGLTKTFPGLGLGKAPTVNAPVLQPVLEYTAELPPETDPMVAYGHLRLLEEEDPLLHPVWDSRAKRIRLQLMGQIQMEILQKKLEERFGLQVTFGAGSVVYRETIESAVEGIGHYEPLRHYAEVHLLLEPGEPGSGIRIDSVCPEDALAKNWQRLIFTHLREKEHPGVLTGAPLTDVRITLLCGKAHLKHTEGGDFRQATYRAVRQGLQKAKSILLEPWYSFRLRLPTECVGRAMTDLQRMAGHFDPPEPEEEGISLLRGAAPAAELQSYGAEVAAYTGGRGRLRMEFGGYAPCRDPQAVIRAAGYDPERDTENPAGSIFCDHGAGFEVKWQDVEAYCHLPPLAAEKEPSAAPTRLVRSVETGTGLDRELMAIFERTYGKIRRRDILPVKLYAENKKELLAAVEPAEEYVLVDGYNIIFAWDELKALAETGLDVARHALMDLLCGYQAYRGCALILVFDAYKVPQGLGSVEKYHNIYCVYTAEAETADAYIERVTYALRNRRRVRVATSDSLEQLIILGHNAQRVSAAAFRQEVLAVQQEIARLSSS